MAATQSFAERQLAKYGWKQGEGLGKERNGIKRAITVSRRTDNRGIGSDSNQWNSNWWDHLYNKASSGTSTPAPKSDEDLVYEAKLAEAEQEPDTLNEYQGMFVRSGGSKPTKNTEKKAVDRTKLVRDSSVHLGAVAMSDAELFAACEGRMARKGARAEQAGKLARVMGDGMPRPEVAAMIEAALSGRATEVIKPKKRKHSKDKVEKKKSSSKRKDKAEKKKKSSSKRKKDNRPKVLAFTVCRSIYTTPIRQQLRLKKPHQLQADQYIKTQPSKDADIKLPMYDMPMKRQVSNLRMVFVVNVFCSTAVSLWVRTEDVFTLLIAASMVIVGFLPLATIQTIYRNHIRSIRILGEINKRVLAKARRAEGAGLSQVEYPVTSNTPLLIKKFSLTGSDPETPLFVRDLEPGPTRRYSISWLYRNGPFTTRFRISKKIIQYHPDLRALDALIRKNASEAAQK
ncbi:hypothetical protein LPJ78_001977 [Coemansia sp. RSA 989]|nr:hypothetical protein LPJ79_001277 [Coemansia sp. RSA 1821]KAJ1866248.1 hypothetical protein LPJ78_001977 [Coemansia sp. RSA 989]